MVNEENCNILIVTDLLQLQHPEIFAALKGQCQKRGIGFDVVQGVKDFWCRDFMPVQVTQNKFVQFQFDPSYYRHSKYCHLRTNTDELGIDHIGTLVKSDIILDGGNISHHKGIAILTEKVFRDNPSYTKAQVTNKLHELLELDRILFIPTIPYDITGHSDGMVRFVNRDTLLINDFSTTNSESFCSAFERSLKQFNVVRLPNEFHRNKMKDDATGDYLNMAIVGDLIFLPAYGCAADALAESWVQLAFPDHTVFPVSANALSAKGGVLHCATSTVYRE